MRRGCPFPLQTRAPMLGNMELSAWHVAILVTFVRAALRSTGKCSFSSNTRVMTAADSRVMLSSNNVDCGGVKGSSSSLSSNDVEMRSWRCEVDGYVVEFELCCRLAWVFFQRFSGENLAEKILRRWERTWHCIVHKAHLRLSFGLVKISQKQDEDKRYFSFFFYASLFLFVLSSFFFSLEPVQKEYLSSSFPFSISLSLPSARVAYL
jgi:hypothetical protein